MKLDTNETSDEEEEIAELPVKQMQAEANPATTSSLPPDSLPVPAAPSQPDEHLPSPVQEQLPGLGTPDLPYSLPFPSSRSPQVLFLVLHGGGVLHSGLDSISKDIDIQNFSQIANDIMKVHYQYALERVSFRLVRCPNICARSLELLCRLNPVQINATDCSGLLPVYGASRDRFVDAGERTESVSIHRRLTNSIPLNVVALLGSECPTYPHAKMEVCKAANTVYQEFLNSEEGKDFNGQVSKKRKTISNNAERESVYTCTCVWFFCLWAWQPNARVDVVYSAANGISIIFLLFWQ